MAEIVEPLIRLEGHPHQKTIGGGLMSIMDIQYKHMQDQLEEYFLSKSIDLTQNALFMTLSKIHRKIFIYSSQKIIIFDIDSNLVESFHDIKIENVCSIGSNAKYIFLGTTTADLIQISYPEVEVIAQQKIGRRNLHVTCINNEGVWIASYGDAIYYYDLNKDKVFKFGTFIFPSEIVVSPNEEYLALYNHRKLAKVFSKKLRYYEIETPFQTNISSIDISNDSSLFAVATEDQIIVYKIDD